MSTSKITNSINKLKELLTEFGIVKNDIKTAISNKLSVQAGEIVDVGQNMSYWAKKINSLGVSQYSDIDGMRYGNSTIREFPEGWKFAPRTKDHAELMFAGCSYITTIPQLDTSKGRSFGNMFNDCSSLTTIPQLDTSSGTSFYNMFFNCKSLTTIPQLDTSSGTSFYNMFFNCSSLTTIPQLDTSSGTSFYSMFFNCSSLTTIPQLDISKGRSFDNMFSGCSSLTTIPQLDISSGTGFYNMFSGCSSLTTIPQLDTSKGRNFDNMFCDCTNLTTIPQLDTSSGTSFYNMFRGCKSLTTLGGFVGLSESLSLSSSTKLTHDSLMNVINNLATVTSSTTLTLGSTNLAKLTDEEKKVATDKGWTLA